MLCPRDESDLKPSTMRGVRYRRCPECSGMWFTGEKLNILKDKARGGDYRWIDIDLWRDRDKFRAGKQERLICPKDKQTMTTVRYADSKVRVDICERCAGVWLDAREFAKIVRYLEEKVNAQTVAGYTGELRDEFIDIFTNPKHAGSEASAFVKVLQLLELRFGVEHRNVAELLRSAGRGIPGA